MTKEIIVDLFHSDCLLRQTSTLHIVLCGKKVTRTNGETELAVRRVKSYRDSSAVLLALVCYKGFSKSASYILKVIFWEDGIIAN